MPGAGGQAGDGSGKPGRSGPGRAEARRPMSAKARVAAPAPRTVPASTRTGTAVRGLAPRLGLEPDSVRLRVVDSDSDRLGHSLAGATADYVYLRPSVLLAPSLPLLAHELAHLAQHRNRTRPPSATAHLAVRPDVITAEAEAAALAAAVAAGRQLWVPRAVLPEGHLARLDGAVGVAPAPPGPAGPGLTPATGPPTSPAEQSTDLAKDSTKLDQLVAKNHQAEIERIRNEVRGIWELSRDKREVALGLLDPFPFVVARALVRSLKPVERRFLALVDDAQHRDHPRSAMAVLAALGPEDIKALDYRLTQGWNAPLHGVDTARLDQAALRGLQAVLTGQSDESLKRLVGSDRRDFFRKLLSTPVPWGDESADIRSALAEEERTDRVRDYSLSEKADSPGIDVELVAHVRELLRNRNAEQARKALSALTPLIESIEEESFGRTAAPEPRPRPAGNAPVEASERMRVVVTELDRDGLVDAILDHLPEADRYRTGPDPSQRYGTVLAAVLAARAPGLTLGRIEDLLSYGIFDWAITDSEARFGYFLVRSLPVAEQDRWRLRDESKWFHRLEDNLPEDMVTSGEYTGVGSEYLPGGPAGSTATAVTDLLGRVLKQWRDSSNAATALAIVERLAPEEPVVGAVSGAAQADATTGAALAADRDIRVAVVRRLDTLGVIDSILEHISHADLVADTGRHEIRRLAELRDPVRLEEEVTNLLSTGLFDWAISGSEAWLSMLLLRSLPLAEQDHWSKAHPDMWASMLSAMNRDMRHSDAIEALAGRDGPLKLADLRERISNPKLWDSEHKFQLRSLIILAYAADDRRWVFELSKRYADLLPGLGADFVTELGLYDPVTRAGYVEEHLEVPGFGSEVLSVVSGGVTIVLKALGPLLLFIYMLGHPTRTIDTEVDLLTIQSLLGGELSGAELTDRQRSVIGAQGRVPRSHRTNMLELHLDPGSGALRLRIPMLELSRVDIVQPGASYRTGRVLLRGLDIKGDFSDRHYREPIGFDFSMDRADVHDAVIANDELGGVALTQVLLSMLKFRSGATGTEDLKQHAPREGTIDIPLLGPLFQALDNTVMLLGGLPTPLDISVVDLILWPLDFGLKNWLLEHAAEAPAGWAGNALVPSPRPLDYAYGLISDGTLRPPRSVAERLVDAARMLRSLSVSFDDLQIKGLALGTAVQIASVRLQDVSAGAARSLPGHLRLVIQSLNRRIPKLSGAERDAAIAQRDAAFEQLDRLTVSEVTIRELREKKKTGKFTDADQANLDKLVEAQNEVVRRRRHAREAIPENAVEDPAELTPPTGAELRMEQLERKDRWHAGSLSPAERQELAQLNTLLRSDVGATLDIGGAEIGAVSGVVEAAGAEVGPIHLDARVPDTLLSRFSASYLADPELIAQFRAGGRRPPTVAELGKSADVSLSVAGLKLQPDPQGGPALRIPPGRLPSLEELQKRLADLPPSVNETIRGRLTDAVEVAKQAEALERQGGQARRVREFRERLRQLLSVEIRQLSVGPVTGRLDPATGEIKYKIADVDARGIIGPELLIDRASGSVEAGARLTAAPGTTGTEQSLLDFAAPMHPTIGVDLTLENVQTTLGRAAKIAIAGLRGSLEASPNRLHLTADSIEIGGLDLGTPESSITGSNARLEGLTADVQLHITGEGDTKMTEVLVTDLQIRQVTGNHLVYARNDGTTLLRVEATHGVLGDIRASSISYRQGASGGPKLDVQATVGTVDVQYEVVRELLTGKGRTSVAGTLTGGAGTQAGPGQTPVAGPALTVGFLQDGKNRTMALDTPGLLATGNKVTTQDGSVTISRLPVTTHLKVAQDEQGVAEVSGTADLNDIEIGPVNWHSGTTRLVSTGGSKVAAVHVEATYRRAEPAKDGAPGTPASLTVSRFGVDGVDVADLHYTDSAGPSPIDLRLGSLYSHPGALSIERIELHDFDLPLTEDGLDLSSAAVKSDITGFHLDARMVYGAIRGAGEINVRRIKVGLAQGGKKATISTTGVSAGVEVGYQDPGEPARTGRKASDPLYGLGHLNIYDAVTGEIAITPEAIEVTGLRIPEMDVTSLYITWGAAGYLHATGRAPARGGPASVPSVSTPTPSGAVYLRDIAVDAKVNRVTGKIELHKMTIDSIEAEGIVGELPGIGTFGLPAPVAGKPLPKLTKLTHVRLGGPTAEGFVISRNRAGLMVAGTVHVDRATIPRLSADMKGMFKGDVALGTDAIDVDLPASGAVDIRVAGPGGKILGKAELDAATTTLELGAIAADALHYSAAGLELENPQLNDLRYADTVAGLAVDVRHATVPGKVTASALSGKIPELDIDDARLNIDFTVPPSKSSGTPPTLTPSPEDLAKKLLDGLKGDIPLAARASLVLPKFGAVDIDDSVSVAVRSGMIDPPDLLRQIAAGWKVTPPLILIRAALGAALDRTSFVMRGNDLRLQTLIPVSDLDPDLPDANVILATWHLSPPDAVLFLASNQLRVAAAIFDLDRSRSLPPSSSGGSGSSIVRSVSVTIGSAAHLDIRTPTPIRIGLAGNPTGHVTLAPDLIKGFHFSGTAVPIGPPGATAGLINLGLDKFEVQDTDLTLTAGKAAGTTVKTGTIKIENAHDGSLTLDEVTPKHLDLQITKAVAHDIEWTLPRPKTK